MTTDTADRSRWGSVPLTVLDLLAGADGPMTPSQIADATGENPSSVKSAVRRLHREGELVNDRGAYALAAPAEPEPQPDLTAAEGAPPARGHLSPREEPGTAYLFTFSGPEGVVFRARVRMDLEQVGEPIAINVASGGA